MPSTTDDCKIYILRQLGEVHEASAPGMQIVGFNPARPEKL